MNEIPKTVDDRSISKIQMHNNTVSSTNSSTDSSTSLKLYENSNFTVEEFSEKMQLLKKDTSFKR